MKTILSIHRAIKPVKGKTVAEQAADLLSAELTKFRATDLHPEGMLVLDSKMTADNDGTGFVSIVIKRKRWYNWFTWNDLLLYAILIVGGIGAYYDWWEFSGLSFMMGALFSAMSISILDRRRRKKTT